MPPHKFREIVFLLLFSRETQESEPEELVSLVMQELKVSRKQVRDAWEKVELILANLLDIDADISEVSTSYDFHRIQKVEMNILRLAFFELQYEKELAVPIIISEAKRLAKKFATPDAAAFCQALIDAYVKRKNETSK
jgi:N utilization substance protein B